MAHSGAVPRARAGIARHHWREVLRSFRDAAASLPLGADDLAALAWAHAWTGDLARGIQTWEQAFAAYSAESHWEAVAAFWVASWHTDTLPFQDAQGCTRGVIMSISFPGESAEYRVARARLLKQEVELRRATEAVAAARRELPPGGAIPEDYVFQEAGPGGAPTDVRLSELFAPGKDTLAIYSFMFPRALDDERPCPSCTSFLDAFDGAAEHITQRVNLAVVAKAPLPRILAHAEERGWRRLRLLSSAGNTYNRDYFGETAEGAQMPMLNVFRRDGAAIRHFWGSELLYAPTEPGQDPRHTDSIDPQWNLFDFTPGGRGTDWYPELSYS